MTKRELKLKLISNEFAKWQVQIENLSSLNLYDANIFSENSICDILNTIFDFDLKHTNSIIKNSPAIDLADSYNRIAIQVTSTKTTIKIQNTINIFFEKKLDNSFDELLIIILGRKQKKYSLKNIPNHFSFDPEKNILDFRDLLKIINYLPTKRIEIVANLMEQEIIPKNNRKAKSNAQRIKRNLALKKRIAKDLLRNPKNIDWNYARYVPRLKFKYDQVIIRSVDDTEWPNCDDKKEGKISSWFKGDLWDFYDNGIELAAMGGTVIFDNKDNWDILEDENDKRGQNNKYKKINCQLFLRIPYEFIVDYDMEPDNYNGLPTIYVEYAKDEMPYEEIVYGLMGLYDDENDKCSLTYYFDIEERKKLK